MYRRRLTFLEKVKEEITKRILRQYVTSQSDDVEKVQNIWIGR